MAKNDFSPEKVGVKQLPTDSLLANPHNPRVLFDEAPLKTLQDSIDKVGILVPLTVYFDKRQEKFVILDGQRRWICAQNLGLPEVPVNQVQEPSLVQNIVTMFQIHKLRQDWDLMPSALKLELLMEELNERNEGRLAALTGLDKAVVSRCKKLLAYPRKYQDMMLEPNPKKRIKADFFIELYAVRNDRLVNSMDWYSRNDFTARMLEKYLEKKGGFKSVTDFRKIKQHITNAKKAGHDDLISEKLKKFCYEDDFNIEDLKIGDAQVSARARSIAKSANALLKELRSLDKDSAVGEQEMWKELQALSKAIRSALRKLGWRVD